MKRLVIIGASAMGREAFAYASDIGVPVKGFLDSRNDVLSDYIGYPPIIGTVEDYQIENDDVFVCALGDPEIRMRYADQIYRRGGTFQSLIHPTAYVGRNVRIEDGTIVAPMATITNDTVVGMHVIVNVATSISHDNVIADYVTICPGCHLAGRVKIGQGVFLGTGVSVIPDICLGTGVYVAAGATVTKSYCSGRLMGVPAMPC